MRDKYLLQFFSNSNLFNIIKAFFVFFSHALLCCCRSALPGASLFEGELFVLALRICMPIHVICSVMQATSLSKVLMGTSSMGLIEVRNFELVEAHLCALYK